MRNENETMMQNLPPNNFFNRMQQPLKVFSNSHFLSNGFIRGIA